MKRDAEQDCKIITASNCNLTTAESLWAQINTDILLLLCYHILYHQDTHTHTDTHTNSGQAMGGRDKGELKRDRVEG